MPEWTHWRKNVDLDAYDERWKQMAESGENPHGEADFVEDVLAGMRPASVLDAGCGTGRVGIELAGRDIDVVGVDLDEDLLADRAAAVAGCARHVGGSGRLVAGFQLAGGWPTIAEYDSWCAAAGLELEGRYSTWDEQPFGPDATYAVSVHRWPAPATEHAEPPDEPVDDWFSPA